MKRPAPPKSIRSDVDQGNPRDGEMHIEMCVSPGPAKRGVRPRKCVVKESTEQKAHGRKMYGPYAADPKKANRLHAARRAAGFASAKAATLAHGWSEPTYRAHETGNRFIDSSWEEVYASAFRVSLAWLQSETGEGPAIDPVREARFKARVAREGSQTRKSAEEAGRRLRVARRVAGYTSVKAAAETLGLKRSTLAAQEVGQNTLSTEAARLYAVAFGCSADWLLTGTGPSGLPAEADAKLGTLLGLHSRLESHVVEIFAGFRPASPGGPSSELSIPAYPRTLTKREILFETVPEISAVELFKAKKKGKTPAPLPGREFGFPVGFLSASFGCTPGTGAMVTLHPDEKATGHLLIDQQFTENRADRFLLVRRDGRTRVLRGDDGQMPGPNDRSEWLVVGKVCAIFEKG
jgi:DNA-binding XRE family transcriptional regulator